jgi:uncharacterized membrane-anchored protein YjiN (DUF445 family)
MWSGEYSNLTIEALAFRTGRGLQWALRIFPPICISLFVLSMFWDVWGIIRSCSIAGLIGFSTNWVAIKMLFWPHQSRPLFGQGLIPSQRNEIIFKVADEVCEKLINETIIRRELDESRLIPRLTAATVDEVRRIVRDPEFVEDTKEIILHYASRITKSPEFRAELLRAAESRFLQYTGRSLTRRVIGRFKGIWRAPLLRIVEQELDALPETIDELAIEVDEVLARLPQELEENLDTIDHTMTRVVMSLIREVDVPNLVLKQLNTVTSRQIEDAFHDFADDKLSYITLLGGLLGLVGGLVIVWPIYSIVVLAAAGALVTGLDVLIYRLMGAAQIEETAPVTSRPACGASPGQTEAEADTADDQPEPTEAAG